MTDAATGEPLPFANVFIPGKFQGTSADFDGNYKLEVRLKTDSLSASSLGYATVTQKVSQQILQTINFELPVEGIGLKEVVITTGEPPEVILFRRIVKAKPVNNPHQFKTFQYESYNKYQIDLDNITPKDLDKNVLLKGFEFLKDYIDTMTDRGKSTLPIFLVEQVSDNYEQADPKKVVERVKGQKMTMLRDNPVITELMSNANQHFNIYENLLTLMGRNFVSPIADYGLSVYKYDVNQFDTLYIDGQPHFTMKFKPKRKGENAFIGKMTVNIRNYAVSSVEAAIPDDVNLGFIKDFQFAQEYIPLAYKDGGDSVEISYVPSKESLKMRFNANIGKGAMLVLRKSRSYERQRINEPVDDNVFDPYKTTVLEDSAYLRKDEYWDTVRHEKLMTTEQGIYEMVDSLKRTSKYKVIKYTVSTLGSGFAKFGPVGFGNIATVFSRNQLEGWRFRLGIMTNRDFSERINIYAYGAYGLGDKRFKYGGKMIFIVSKKPWHKLAFSGRSDIDLMSRHAEEMDRDNVFTLVQKKNVSQQLYNMEEVKVVYDNEFYKDMTSYLTLQYRRMAPLTFEVYDGTDSVPIDNIITSEIGYAIRWQHKSQSLPGTFDRDAKANRFFAQFRKKTAFPVVWVRYMAGLPDILGSQFRYHDISLGFQGDVTVTAKQSMYYNLWLGKIFGTVPFLLLKNPEGNFAYVHNKYMFNNMNLLEFSADEYVSLNYQYFFGGWIGDRIPYIKKLRWRLVATSNIFYGTVTKGNMEFNQQNRIGIAYPVPYVEAGFAIENILNFIRFDFIWRVTQRDLPEAFKFGVYGSLFIKV